MGLTGAPTTQQKKKKRPGSLESGIVRDSAGHDDWRWGSFESLSTEVVYHDRETPVHMSSESPDSSHNLISPFIPGSTTSSASLSPSSHSTTPVSGVSHGKTTSQRPRKNDSSESFGSSIPMKDDAFHFSRWDSARYSAERGRGGKNMCSCAAGLTADLAAVCCCPFSVLHLFAIAFIKLPTVLLSRSLARLKKTVGGKRKKSTVIHEVDSDSVAATSCPPSRTRSYESNDARTWGPALAFGEQSLWRDYFDSPDAGAWSAEDPVRSKS